MKKIFHDVRQYILSSTAKTNAFVIFVYIAVSLVATYPLARNFSTTNVGGLGDDMVYVWNLWWIKHSIMDLHTNPFYTDYVCYPNITGLSYHSFIFLNGLISIPLQYFLPLIAVYNILFLLSFVLSGFGVYLLLDRYLEDRYSAFAGGLIFAMSRLSATGGLGSTHWMPIFVYFLLKAVEDDEDQNRNILLAGVLLAFNFLSEYYYFIAMAIVAVSLLGVTIIKKGRVQGYRALKKITAIALVALPFTLPVLWMSYMDSAQDPSRTIPGGGLSGINLNVADVFGFFSPSKENPIVGGLNFSHLFTGQENYAYLGILPFALLIAGFIKRDRKDTAYLFFFVSFAIFAVMTMGPYPHVLGREIPVPLPYKLFEMFPVLKNARSPVRFHTVTMLFVSILAGYGFKKLFNAKKIAFAIIPLVALEFLVPVSLGTPGHPAYLDEIRKDAEARTVLDVPFFVRDGFISFPMQNPVVAMYYQTIHGKKTFTGYISRLPVQTFFSYMNLPVLRSVAFLEYKDRVVMGSLKAEFSPDTLETDKRLAATVIDLFGIDYIIFHKKYDIKDVEDYLRGIWPLSRVFEDADIRIYKTFKQKKEGVRIKFGDESSIPHLMSGWINGQRYEETAYAWSTGKRSVILASLSKGKDYEMRIRMFALAELPDLKVSVYCNDKFIDNILPQNRWQEYIVKIPSRAVARGLNRIRFEYSGATDVGLNYGGSWAKGDVVKKGGIIGNSNKFDFFDWQQNNSVFQKAPTSIAVDYIEINEVWQ